MNTKQNHYIMDSTKLSEREREAKRQYLREWRKKNPEKNRELNRKAEKRFYQKKAKEYNQ